MFCVAFLAMRVGGLHLHLCLDGSEVPSAVHFADSGLHHGDAGSEGHAVGGQLELHHDDIEVNLASDVTAKLAALDLPVIVGALFIAFALLPWLRTPVPRGFLDGRVPRKSLHLRPPLRGPPRFSFA